MIKIEQLSVQIPSCKCSGVLHYAACGAQVTVIGNLSALHRLHSAKRRVCLAAQACRQINFESLSSLHSSNSGLVLSFASMQQVVAQAIRTRNLQLATVAWIAIPAAVVLFANCKQRPPPESASARSAAPKAARGKSQQPGTPPLVLPWCASASAPHQSGISSR